MDEAARAAAKADEIMPRNWFVVALVLVMALSVILQVWVFKATKGPSGQGRRIFRMAPLHHHFELGGLGEEQVVIRFWAVSLLLVVVGLLLLP